MTIDWTKPILWDGKPARVLATDMAGTHPILVRTHDGGSLWCKADGENYSIGHVTNAPERVERWANAYLGAVGGSTRVRSDLDSCAGSRTALVRYVFEGDKLVSAEVVPLEDKP